MLIKKEDRVLLLIKNLINNKINKLYIKIFKIKEVKSVIALLKLLNIKIFLKFHVSLFKKVLLNTELIKT